MSEPTYEIDEADGDSFTVSVMRDDVAISTVGFATRKEAVNWAEKEREKAGHDRRWPEI